jgi:phage tail sheath protein FI
VRQSGAGGIFVAEAPGAESPIARLPSAVTAFVGRTLRGPVQRPVTVTSFAEFHSIFGGLWQPSPLSYSVEQYFENGGRSAVIVRVVNGGGPATISLPCGADTLTLEALSPGSRETLRASVDYDNIGPAEPDRFNLVLQRVRFRGSEHIEDQEIFRRLSVVPATTRFVATALQESMLARVRGDVPATRPDPTFRAGTRHPIGYVDSNPDGDDGAPLTDYDVIGSREARTGLFALSADDEVRFLCIPPLARDRDIGPSVLIVAERRCRELHAMLVIDPPMAWETCDEALRGLHEFEFRSDHALMCFPRVVASDRLRGRPETFANCGAVAGTLARHDSQRSLWEPGDDDELLLRPGTRPQCMLSDAERQRLLAHGVNPLQSLRSAAPRMLASRTLAGGAATSVESALLTAQRRRMLLVASIERGTRWAMFEGTERSAWPKLERQVREFLQPLADAGLFGAHDAMPAFEVVCDERINGAEELAAGRVSVLVSLRSERLHGYQSFLLTQSRAGSQTRTVMSNVLPAGIRMSVRSGDARRAQDAGPGRRPTLAQALYGHYAEPRADPSAVLRVAEAPAPGRLDADAIARIHRDFRRGLQGF